MYRGFEVSAVDALSDFPIGIFEQAAPFVKKGVYGK